MLTAVIFIVDMHMPLFCLGIQELFACFAFVFVCFVVVVAFVCFSFALISLNYITLFF